MSEFLDDFTEQVAESLYRELTRRLQADPVVDVDRLLVTLVDEALGAGIYPDVFMLTLERWASMGGHVIWTEAELAYSFGDRSRAQKQTLLPIETIWQTCPFGLLCHPSTGNIQRTSAGYVEHLLTSHVSEDDFLKLVDQAISRRMRAVVPSA